MPEERRWLNTISSDSTSICKQAGDRDLVSVALSAQYVFYCSQYIGADLGLMQQVGKDKQPTASLRSAADHQRCSRYDCSRRLYLGRRPTTSHTTCYLGVCIACSPTSAFLLLTVMATRASAIATSVRACNHRSPLMCPSCVTATQKFAELTAQRTSLESTLRDCSLSCIVLGVFAPDVF